MGFLKFIIFVTFFIFLFMSLKFLWGNEGKDERGQQIFNFASAISLPIFPIGWLFIESYNDYINNLSFDQYRELIGLLIPITYIMLGFTIYIKKRFE